MKFSCGILDPNVTRSRLVGHWARNTPICRGNKGRGGFILLIVLLAIISAMALTYVVASTSYLSVRKVRNAQLRDSAKAAAEAGLSVGLSRMCSSIWGGIGSKISGTCGENQGFEVSYEHGDPAIGPESPEWADLPYRVTIRAVGKAWHPGESDRPSVYQKSWVVQLVPRAVAAEPSAWSTILKYAFYQTAITNSSVNIPSQIIGKCRFQSGLSVAPNYPTSDPRRTYMSDLYAMKSDGYGDWRPFRGPLHLPCDVQAPVDLILLVSLLRVSVNHLPSSLPGSDLAIEKDVSSYQLYPGGRTYTVPRLGSSLENTTLMPDAADNPAGIFYAPGTITIGSNVSIRGSLFCNGDVSIEGTNIDIRGQPLRGIQEDTPLEMPAIVCKSLQFKAGSGCEIQGILGVFGEMKALGTSTMTNIRITGRVFATSLKVDPLSPWESFGWDAALAQFQEEKHGLVGENRYFPLWLQKYGLNITPRFVLQPPENNRLYHWKKKADPVYVPFPSDTTSLDPQAGLRWELIRELDGQ